MDGTLNKTIKMRSALFIGFQKINMKNITQMIEIQGSCVQQIHFRLLAILDGVSRIV